jgi:hypothetical protein
MKARCGFSVKVLSWAALALLVAAGGCGVLAVGGAAGAGAFFYIKGEVSRVYAAKLDDAWKATDEAMKSFDLRMGVSNKDEFGGTMRASRANGDEVVARFKRLGPTSTELGIRVGTLGDRSISEQTHDKILKLLQDRGQIVKAK